MASVPAPTTAHRGGSYDRLGDERLASLAGRGDHGAAEEIHGRYADALLAYSRSIVRDPDDAQDVLQQTMLNALQALSRRELQAPLRPWLFRIAHNTSISLLRRRRPTDELREDGPSTGQGMSAETESLARERLRELVDDVAALPERQRTALLLHDVAGLPHAQVAAELGCTDGASRQTVTAARVALREAALGREVPCTEVRVILDAGDRRRLRARPIRAHLRTCTGCSVHAVRTTPPSMAGQPSGLLGTLLQGFGVATTTVGVPAVAGSMATKAALVLTVAATAAAGGVVEGGIAPPTRHVTAHPTLVAPPSPRTVTAATASPPLVGAVAPSPAPSGVTGAAVTTAAVSARRSAGAGGSSPSAREPADLSFGGRRHAAGTERDGPPSPEALRTAAGTGPHGSPVRQDIRPTSASPGDRGRRDAMTGSAPLRQAERHAPAASARPERTAPAVPQADIPPAAAPAQPSTPDDAQPTGDPTPREFAPSGRRTPRR